MVLKGLPQLRFPCHAHGRAVAALKLNAKTAKKVPAKVGTQSCTSSSSRLIWVPGGSQKKARIGVSQAPRHRFALCRLGFHDFSTLPFLLWFLRLGRGGFFQAIILAQWAQDHRIELGQRAIEAARPSPRLLRAHPSLQRRLHPALLLHLQVLQRSEPRAVATSQLRSGLVSDKGQVSLPSLKSYLR